MNQDLDQVKQEVNTFVEKQSRLFSFLTDPDHYLLGAGLLSGGVSLLFIALNLIALDCILSNCAALQEDSNTLSSWLVFEGLTLFFSLSSWFSLRSYRRRRRTRSEQSP